MNIGELKQLQSLPIEYKEKKTVRIVKTFIAEYDAYISIGGADSYALNYLLEKNRIYLPKASIPLAEPYGNNKLNANLQDITFLRPHMQKKDIITKYGYPIISKQLSMAISRYHNTKREDQKKYRLHGRINDQGKKENAGTIPQKYHILIYAPFDFTEKCCDIIKKRPLKKFAKENYLYPITGELAEESDTRLQEYLKHGCIMNDKKGIKCTPLGFWTQQDLLQYRLNNNIPLSQEYKSIVPKDQQTIGFTEHMFSGEQRTGCDICTFGIMYDKDRFKRMKENNHLIWSSMMNGGQWAECKPRLMILKPNTDPVMSNKKWVPSKNGYGYRFVIEWLNKMVNLGILID